MTELRLTIIKDQDKRVEIHITDADAVLNGIKSNPTHPLAAGAGELLDLVGTALAECGDTDKIEIGPDGAFQCNASGKTPIAL